MSTSFAALRGLPFGLASPAVPLADASRGPKLLEYLFLGDPAIGAPDGLPDMPSTDDGRPEPRLDGTNGGDGRKGVTGDDAKLLPAPVGDGGIRDDVGDCAGRPGSDGPVPPDSGECWRRDGDGEASDGEPEEMVDDLNAFTEAMGLRIGTPLGDALSCYIQVMVINVNARSPCQKVPRHVPNCAPANSRGVSGRRAQKPLLVTRLTRPVLTTCRTNLTYPCQPQRGCV